MRWTLGRGFGALLAAAVWTCSAPAAAQEEAATRAAARKLAEDGVAALQAGDSAKAVAKLDKAFRTLPAPSIALWSGRALAKHGQLVEAAERLLEATRLPVSGDLAVQEQAKADAQKELELLRPRIPTLVVHVEAGDGARIDLDGKGVPAALLGEEHPVNPGTHQLVGQRGAQHLTQSVTIAEGERKEVTLRFDAAATATAAAPSPEPVAPPPAGGVSVAPAHGSRTLAFVALGLGGTGLVLGGVTGALALTKKNALEDDTENCAGNVCDRTVESEVNSLGTFRTVSTVSFIAGGVLAATGVVLLLTRSGGAQQGQARASTTLALTVTPGELRLRGSF